MKTSYLKIKSLTLIILIAVAQSVAAQSAVKPVVRLVMNTSGFNDETVFYFEQGGTTGFQSAFDAYKLVYGSVPYLGSMSDSILTSISGLPELNVNITVPVKAITPASGSFTFSSVRENFPEGVCVTLFDSFTGITTNILSNSYTCTLYDTTSIARFTMNFYTSSSSWITQIRQPVCSSPNGMISASGTGSGPWDYEWKNGDSIIKTCLNKNAPDSLTNLKGGNYSVKIKSAGGCSQFTETFMIEQIVVPVASFEPDAFKTSLSNSGKVNFTNTSQNAQLNSWNFGDNSGTWFIPSPSHNYLSPGTYTVTLVSESISHCKSTAQRVIQVVDDLTGISTSNLNTELRLATLSQGNYALNMVFGQALNVDIQVYDLKGNIMNQTRLEQITRTNHPIDLEAFAPGMYLVKVTTGNGAGKTFKLLK